MLTRKILSSTAALAMTASIALLAGCPTPGGTPTPTETPTESTTATATATPVSTATATPVSTATATPVSTATATATSGSASPSANSSTTPVNPTGTTSDIKERATFNGKVYDPNGIVVEGANVTAKSVDANVSWVGEAQVSTNGAYVFRNAPVGARVEITVTKDGWTTRVRTEVLKSNLQGDPTANVFDFGGLGATGQDQTSSFYAIQDEPEIISLKINGKQATNSGGFPIGAGATSDLARCGDVAPADNVPDSPCAGAVVAVGVSGSGGNNGRFGIANLQPADDLELKSSIRNGQPLSVSLTGVDNDRLDVEMIFSEPVDRESVQNNFKVLSQAFDVRSDKRGFEIDENLSSLTFKWASDDKSVLVQTNKPILTTTTTPEARYLLKWTNPFKDKTEKNALKVGQGNISPTGHFRYNPGTNNDFNVFGVKIDDQDPRLLSIQALDGGSANDVVRLTFSEPLEVVNQSSQAFGLGDPADNGGDSARQLWAYNTNNGGTMSSAANNQATVVGYNADITTPADGVADEFRAVYMISRLPQNIDDSGDVKAAALAGDIWNATTNAIGTTPTIDTFSVDCVPAKGNPNPSGNVGNQSLLRFAKIDGNVVTMEFAPEAFNRNEKLIVSIGENINTSYQDTSRSVSRTPVRVSNDSCGAVLNPPYSDDLIDPAGNGMSNSNSTTSGNLQVDDSLRVATAS